MTNYEAVVKGKDGEDVLVWRRSNDRVHIEHVDFFALVDVETGGSFELALRFGTM